MKKLLFYLILIGLVTNALAQEKWCVDRRVTAKPYVGKFTPLPNDNYNWENTNTTTRVIYTGSEMISVGPNVRVHPGGTTIQQDEIILIKSPINPLIMFGGANTTANGVYGQGGYWTTDGGVTWAGNDLLSPFTQNSSDPGPCIDKNGTIIFTTLDSPGFVAAYSTNNGVTWSSRVTIVSGSEDKNFAASDDAPSSTYYGRSYAVWSNFQPSNPPCVISYTTNGGVSWSSMFQVNTPPSGHYSQGCDIAIGPTGQVYVVWASVSSGSLIEDYLGFARSTTGGTSFTVTENAYDMNGIRASTFNGWNFRVNSFPRIAVDRSGGARNGWIYVVSTDKNLSPAGTDPDVIMHKSTDGGVTWSTGIRVNQDALNNGKVQFFPAICVDQYGGIDICYYDNRNYPSVGDSCETYMSRSTDGGTTWTDLLVSDHRWRVAGEAGLGSYGGDYIGITSQGNKVWPFWFDNKTGSMQAWTAAVDITPTGVESNNNNVPADYSLGQNYPNPFNPTTNIKFDIPKTGHVKLAVYDMLGNQVALLVNNDMKAGSYTTDFNASNLSSGVYFYKIEANDFVLTKKMILTK